MHCDRSNAAVFPRFWPEVAFAVLATSVVSLMRREVRPDIIALLFSGGALLLKDYVTARVIGLMPSSGRALEDFPTRGRARRDVRTLLPRSAHGKLLRRWADRERAAWGRSCRWPPPRACPRGGARRRITCGGHGRHSPPPPRSWQRLAFCLPSLGAASRGHQCCRYPELTAALSASITGRPPISRSITDVARLSEEHERLSEFPARLRAVADRLATPPPAGAAVAVGPVENRVEGQ